MQVNGLIKRSTVLLSQYILLYDQISVIEQFRTQAVIQVFMGIFGITTLVI